MIKRRIPDATPYSYSPISVARKRAPIILIQRTPGSASLHLGLNSFAASQLLITGRQTILQCFRGERKGSLRWPREC